MKELAAFLSQFVRPLVSGGEARIAGPIDPETVKSWEPQLGEVSPPLVAIDAAREAVAAELVVRPPAMVFGSEELRLAVALYDALVLAHPDLDRWLARNAVSRVRKTALDLARADPPEGRRDLLSRHALFHNLFDLSRVDMTVRWWTGKAEFRGMRPPPRLILWRGLRRVREEQARVPFHEILAGSSDEAAMVEALLRATPLTDLFHPVRPWPAFRWQPCVPILADDELARAVAYHWLQADDPLRVAAAATLAWERMLVEKAPAEDVRAVAAFLVHVGALLAVGETHDVDLDAPSARLARALGDASDAGAHLFLALPDIAAEIDPALGAPPGVDEDPRLSRRWRAHRKQVRAGVDVGKRAAAAEKLSAALGAD